MFKKPSKKGISDNAVTVGSAVAGAAISDGVVSLIPDEYKKWGKPAFALATLIAAAATKGSDTLGKSMQGAFAGMSIKQGLDTLREMVFSKVQKDEAGTQFAEFKNKVLGLGSAGSQVTVPSIGSSMFNRSIAPRSNENMLASAQSVAGSSRDMLA